MYKVHTKYQKLEQEDQIELFAVSMEEEPAVNFSGRKQAFASLESSVSVNSEKDGADGGEEGFVNIPQNDPTDPIAVALEKCDHYVLKPYRFVLRMLGWNAFTRYDNTLIYKILRWLLVGFWLLVIVVTFITQLLSCFRRDSTLPAFPMNLSDNETIRAITCEEHAISAFILTDFLLLASYLFGLYLFTQEETEYLSNLASKVFIKNANNSSANTRLVYTIVFYFVLGLAWVVASLLVRIMTTISVEMWEPTTVIVWGNSSNSSALLEAGLVIRGGGKVIVVILALIGFVFFDLVYVAAVMNYAAQSEMNIYLLVAIKKLVQDKGYGENGLEASIKDIIECRKYLKVLNGKTATATALILFNLGSAGIAAIINLERISHSPVAQFNSTELATVTAGFNVLLWVGLVSFPFIQAARVTDACLEVKSMGTELRARPQLYSSTPQLELDSYVTLTHAVKLRATMFGVPIYPWMWWAVFSAVTFLALLLFQTGTYSFTRYL